MAMVNYDYACDWLIHGADVIKNKNLHIANFFSKNIFHVLLSKNEYSLLVDTI